MLGIKEQSDRGKVHRFVVAIVVPVLEVTAAIALVGSCAFGSTARSGGGTTPAAQAAASAGISKARAVEIARTYVSRDARDTSAESGRFADVYRIEGMGPIEADLANREVWAVHFESQFTICPPDGSGCWSPRPGFTTVVLDYYTGDWIHQSAYSPRV